MSRSQPGGGRRGLGSADAQQLDFLPCGDASTAGTGHAAGDPKRKTQRDSISVTGDPDPGSATAAGSHPSRWGARL